MSAYCCVKLDLFTNIVIRSFYSALVFWTDVTKGVWNVVRLQTMDRDGSPEMLSAGSMNIHVSAHPSYYYISNFQVSVFYIQQHKHTTLL